MSRAIQTANICPPIPYRGCDWAAWWDGTEGEGPTGYGATREAAIDDLIDNYPDEWPACDACQGTGGNNAECRPCEGYGTVQPDYPEQSQ